MKLWAIAMNTFREFLRDRILYNIMAFALFLIVISIAIGQLTIAERKRITIDLSLTSISLIGVMIAIFLGISLVSREIDKKTIYTLIAKPVERYLFILGRFLGLMMTIGLNLVIMTAAFAAVLWATGGSSERQFDWPIVQALILIYVELGIITAAAMVFSSFSSPTLSAIFTIAFFLAGRLMSGVSVLIRKQHEFTRRAAEIAAYIIPNLTNYVQVERALLGDGMPLALFARSVGVGLLTTAFLLMLAMLIFHRRDFV
jgi:ABC-type transport system involved in multi-copper enzyme maturation permease subunit